jgi:deoxyadenosine/deoxycytidine kinase
MTFKVEKNEKKNLTIFFEKFYKWKLPYQIFFTSVFSMVL